MSIDPERNEGRTEPTEADHERDEQVAGADGGPVDDADMAAAEGLRARPEQAAHYREMAERGAHQAGEGAPEA